MTDDRSDEIAHLDSRDVSPFELVVALQQTLVVARLALATQLQVLAQDARKDDSEAYLLEAVSHVWGALEAVHASIEAGE